MANAGTTSLAEESAEFFTGLFGLKTTASVDPSLELASVGCLATYTDDGGEVRGRIVCDLQGAAILGAALTQIPMGRVTDAVKSAELPDNLRENLSEVLNISVNMLPGHVDQRLVLRDVNFQPAEDELETAKASSTGVKLDVQRYGECRLLVS
jgi:hypothetical protein